jgi:hypothetical protein
MLINGVIIILTETRITVSPKYAANPLTNVPAPGKNSGGYNTLEFAFI